MEILTSKWAIVFIVIVFSFIVLNLVGCKSVHTEIDISASPENVWNVLTDTQKIKEWNKVLIPIEGELEEGNTIKYEFHQDENNLSLISAKVEKIEENKLLNQSGGMPLILTFDHKYILEESNGGTKVIIHEDYRGAMVPFWDPAPVEQAYSRLNVALKERVESLTKKELE